MPTQDVQNDTTAVITPSPLMLSEFKRCLDNPEFAINKYFNSEKDPKKIDCIVDIMNRQDIELSPTESNYNYIACFCLYRFLFFPNTKIYYLFDDFKKRDNFLDLIVKIYIDSKLKLKPILISCTSSEVKFFNGSSLSIDSNINQIFDKHDSIIMDGIDTKSESISKKIRIR